MSTFCCPNQGTYQIKIILTKHNKNKTQDQQKPNTTHYLQTQLVIYHIHITENLSEPRWQNLAWPRIPAEKVKQENTEKPIKQDSSFKNPRYPTSGKMTSQGRDLKG